MQSQCGDGATPGEVAEIQSKLEWFTHFSACQVDQHLVLLGATLQQIRSVMATLRVKPEVPESSGTYDSPTSHGDCQPTLTVRELLSTKDEHSRAIVKATLADPQEKRW